MAPPQHSDPCPAHTAAASQLASQDILAARREYLFRFPSSKLLQRWLCDGRDAPCAWLLANIAGTVVPAAALLHAMRLQSHALGAAYLLATYGLFLQVWL
jgi:hypothetical protein